MGVNSGSGNGDQMLLQLRRSNGLGRRKVREGRFGRVSSLFEPMCKKGDGWRGLGGRAVWPAQLQGALSWLGGGGGGKRQLTGEISRKSGGSTSKTAGVGEEGGNEDVTAWECDHGGGLGESIRGGDWAEQPREKHRRMNEP